MSERKKPETVVEFKDDHRALEAPGHKARRIYINGTEVLVEAGSVELLAGDNEVTKVMLTLLPKEVHFNTEEPPL